MLLSVCESDRGPARPRMTQLICSCTPGVYATAGDTRMNHGVCGKCKARVPVQHVLDGGKVYLETVCPDCGRDRFMISSNAESWQAKPIDYRDASIGHRM